MTSKTPGCVGFVALQLLLAVVLFSLCTSAQHPIPDPINALQVFALPVAQGDCTFMQCPNGNIIVYDCGSSPGGRGLTALGVQQWLDNRESDVRYILVTHPHLDHYSYLPSIQWDYTALQGIIIGGQLNDYPEGFRNWINNNNIMVHLISNGQRCIGNCALNQIDTNFCNDQNYQFNILAANVGNTPNQKSIVMKVVVGGWSMLLSGDMEGGASIEIANQLGEGLRSVVYKMSHHGASGGNMVPWLNRIRPQYAFASSGYNYGNCKHPRCDTINNLINLGSVTQTAPHQFYCGLPGGPVNYDNFEYNMLETSPGPNVNDLCILTYVSNVNIQPEPDCWTDLTQHLLTDEMTYVEECDDLEDNSTSENGTLQHYNDEL